MQNTYWYSDSVSPQGGYDAGYFYECAIGPKANGAEIVASEPLRALPIENCDDVPVSCVKIRSRFLILIHDTLFRVSRTLIVL